ncbi:uncharacterized protein BJX67DRAFT_142326 [Aspergillus lucknowensis]|uniref:Uncharacterized protein n=1 Tax=Aspergillus lucknowensis TaxID=176173 RepID=A0ABR4LPA1_9EURO
MVTESRSQVNHPTCIYTGCSTTSTLCNSARSVLLSTPGYGYTRKLLGFLQPQQPQQHALHRQQTQHDVVIPISKENQASPSHSIEDKMVRRRDDRQRHEHRPQRRNHTKEPVRTKLHQTMRDEHRVPEVQRRHRGDCELESVLCPRRTPLVTVQDVDESEFLGQEPRGHAAPQGYDCEGEDILEGHRASNSLVLVALHEGIAVDVEHDANDDVRVVHAGEKRD